MELTQMCTGCMACYNKCPNNAISIVYNDAGFYSPKIDKKLCTKCGLCSKVCPQESIDTRYPKQTKKCFAATCSDEFRKNSASGGVFAMLAEYFLDQGGYVCGATFTKNFRAVEHIIISDKNDLIKLQNSKYVQSNIKKTLSQIEKLLQADKKVLFSGTSCQVAGLKAYLGKDYDNLFTIDILCHGIPSPLVWEKYVDEIAKKRNVLNASFRNKKYGWRGEYKLELDFENGHFSESSKTNLYYRTFFEHLATNEACFSCKYTNLYRTSDITLGDFWGINRINSDLDDNKGLSIVLINTSKAEEVITQTYNKFEMLEQIDIDLAVKYTPRLYTSDKKNFDRTNFIKNLQLTSITKNIKENLCPQYDGIIRNFWGSSNFGAALSAYAIQQYFLQNGKHYHILNNYSPDKFTEAFANKYLKLTHAVWSKIHYKELDKCSNNFVLGTDQILRADFMRNNILNDLFGYSSFSKNRFVFSGSFGITFFDRIDIIDKLKYSILFKRFNAISTRELSGVDICKKEFNIKAQCIIDPVLLVDKKHWTDMVPDTQDKYKNKIVCYFLGKNIEREKIKSYLKDKYKKDTMELINGEIPIEEFLAAIKDADYIVTNSFHAICFALIFNKKFIGFHNSKVDARFASLAQIFNIQHLILGDSENIYTKNELFLDYDKKFIADTIEKERIKAKKWFDKNINSKNKNIFITLLSEINYIFFRLFERLFRLILNICINIKFHLLCKYAHKKIVFWGASLFLKDFLEKNPKIANKIIGIIDINPATHYKRIKNCTIYPPEKLSELEADLVISTVKNNHENVYPQIRKILNEQFPNIELLPDIFG